MAERMMIELSPDVQSIVQEAVDAGDFGTHEEFVAAAVRMAGQRSQWRRRTIQLTRLRQIDPALQRLAAARHQAAMKLYLSDLALLNIEELGDYIARDSPMHAERFVDRFAEIDRLSHAPLHFAVYRQGPPGFLKAIVDPYVIYFGVEASEVFVERVLHGSRNILEILR